MKVPPSDDVIKAALDSREVVPLDITLRDWAGQPIQTWRFVESHEGYGGLGTLGLMMKAFGTAEGRAVLDVPGLDPRAQWYFTVSLAK